MTRGINGYRKEKQRLFCEGHVGKVKFFKKMLKKWDEEMTDDGIKFVVTIADGFSFLEEDHMSTMTFDTVTAATSAMKSVFVCGCDTCNPSARGKK